MVVETKHTNSKTISNHILCCMAFRLFYEHFAFTFPHMLASLPPFSSFQLNYLLNCLRIEVNGKVLLAFGERIHTHTCTHARQQPLQIKSKWISLGKVETMLWLSNSSEMWLLDFRKEVIVIFVSTCGKERGWLKLIGWLFGKLYILTKMLQYCV